MGTSATSSVVTGLRDLVGETGVLVGSDMEPLMTDWRGVFPAEAVAIVRPADTDAVAEVVRFCAAEGIAVVSQGGNTGLSGGTSPANDRPTVVVNLGRMREIESIDAHRWSATVQAGVTIQALQEAAAGHDRLFAPDWGARGTATIGGAIATNAGGNNVLRYGTMRSQVLGLEVVLADGRVWNGLRALRKDASGYDLKQLFIGSEGTLGVVTRAVLALRPATPNTQSALATLRDLDGLNRLYELAQRAAPDMVTAFELIPEVGLARVCRVFELARPIETGGDWYVLVKLGSGQPVDDAMTRLLEQAADAGLVSDAVVAATAAQEERLWTIRDELPAARLYPETQAAALKMDTAVPIDAMVEYHEQVRRIAADVVPGAHAYGFGHVGDGNIHMTVLPASADDIDDFLPHKAELQARMDALTFAMGGSLSAEHGIGRELRERVEPQKSALEWELMRRVKAALDPDDIMNPNILLPPTEIPVP